jgi:SAM-dependent methyltransferase
MVFNSYAAYYDLLYKEKNYKEEAAFVHQQIQQNFPGAKTILDLGCGTGKHAYELAKLGYEVTGVDLSQQMVDIAIEKTPSNLSLDFCQGDIRNIRLNRQFDAIVSLFHVMSYQVSNNDLLSAFATAKKHLNQNGIFLFDAWYGPGVLTDLPVVRIKRMEDEQILVLRIAEPVIHTERNVVDVNYEVHVKIKESGSESIINEKHIMRYIFDTEIEFISNVTGLTPLITDTKIGAILTPSNWFKVFISKNA